MGQTISTKRTENFESFCELLEKARQGEQVDFADIKEKINDEIRTFRKLSKFYVNNLKTLSEYDKDLYIIKNITKPKLSRQPDPELEQQIKQWYTDTDKMGNDNKYKQSMSRVRIDSIRLETAWGLKCLEIAMDCIKESTNGARIVTIYDEKYLKNAHTLKVQMIESLKPQPADGAVSIWCRDA
jgi:hypothetical protein